MIGKLEEGGPSREDFDKLTIERQRLEAAQSVALKRAAKETSGALSSLEKILGKMIEREARSLEELDQKGGHKRSKLMLHMSPFLMNS